MPPDLTRVVHHALERLPAERYPDLAALAADLRAILASRPISIAAPSLAHLGRLWLRRHQRGVKVGLAVSGVVFVALAAAWIVAGVRTRGSMLERLVQVQPEHFTTQADFLQSFQPLFELEQESRAFEGSWLRGAFFGGAASSVQGVADTWSRSLGAFLERERAERLRLGMAPPTGLYPQLFQLDKLLVPGDEHNAEARARGKTRISAEALRGKEWRFDLYSFVDLPPPDQVFAFRPTPRAENLVAGTYRLQLWEPGAEKLAAEVVFFVPEGWPAEILVTPRPPRAEFLASALPVAATEVGLLADPGRIPVAAFRVLDHLVTLAEFERFQAETGYRSTNAPANASPHTGSDHAVAVEYEAALAFAAWAGGRLPTEFELQAAEAADAVHWRAFLDQASGEFLQDMFSPRGFEGTWRAYADEQPPRYRMAQRTFLMGDESSSAHPGFRIVFSDDRPEAYGRLAEQPVKRGGD